MLRVQLSGKVEVTVDGQAVALGSKKAQAVLVALALSGGRLVTIERLVGLVWDEDPPRTAEQTLQSYVTRLRGAMGPDSIERVGGAYRLNVEPARVDLVHFEQLLDDGDVDAALGMWQGSPLAGLAPSSALAAAVVSVGERHVAATEDQLAAKIEQGRAADVVGRLRELTNEHPYRESVWGLLMRALYLGGRQSDALRAYSDARARLIDDLGIEPGPALRELESQILSHDESLAVDAAVEPAERSDIQPSEDAAPPRDVTDASVRVKKLLAGRDIELTMLRGLAERHRGIAYVRGDAGAGKSMLIESYLDELGASGWRTAKGICINDDAGPPLWSWRQVFRELELDESLILASSEINRFELFDSMLRALHAAADEGPLAVCIDDLHWSGEDTRRFFSYVGQQVAHHNLVMIGAGRSVPPEFSGLDLAWVELSPLDTAAISTIVEAETGLVCDNAAAQRLLDRTGGNPFFVTELARAAGRSQTALDPDVDLPGHVRAAVQQRLQGLPSETMRLLDFVALVLVECSVELIAEASNSGVDDVTRTLAPAFDAGVLISDGSGTARFRFDHAITRETVEEGLNAEQQAQLHAALGHALDGLLQSADIATSARLSRHFALGAPAGTAIEAVMWASVAAQQAAQTWSHADAVVHLERAQRAMTHARDLDPSLEASVLIRLGTSARIVGDAAKAQDALFQAFRVGEQMGDAHVMAEAALAMAEGYGSDTMSLGWVPGAEALAAMERALEATSADDSRERAALLGQLAADRYDRATSTEGDENELMLEEALAMSVRLDDPISIVRSRQFRRAALGWKWDFDYARSHDYELLELTREHALPGAEIHARNSYIATLLNCGDLDAVRSMANEITTDSRLSGTRLARYYDIRMQMMLAVLRCDWATVDGLATAAMDADTGLGPEFESGIINQYGMALIYQGSTDLAVEHLRHSAQVGDRLMHSRILFSVLASSGQFDEAAEVLTGIDLTTRSGGQFGRGYALESVCEGLAALGRADELPDLVELLMLTRDRLVMNSSGRDGLLLLGPTRYFLARALTVLGRLDEADEHLSAARPRLEQLQAKPHLVQLDFATAMVALARHGPSKARGQVEHTMGVANDAGMMDYARLLEHGLDT